MILDLPDNMVNDLIKVLGEVPAKMSYVMLQTISQQAAEHNKRMRELMARKDIQGPINPGVEPNAQPQ